jgi:predicted phage baseplate assembly protein
LIEERIARQRACRRPHPEIPCPGVTPPAEPPRVVPSHHSARVAWEAFTGTWVPLTAAESHAALAPGEVADDTRSLTLDGIVDFNLPAGITRSPQGAIPGSSSFYLRCRLVSGASDSPPALLEVAVNAVPVEQSIPLTQRFEIPDTLTPTGASASVPTPGETTRLRMTTGAPAVIASLAFDPAAAGLPDIPVLGYEKTAGTAGHITLAAALVGHGNRLPDQQFTLPARAIVSDAMLSVFSHDGTVWQRWDIRPSFDASQRTDWHCTLDRARGVLTFGNGERGRVLAGGHAVFVMAHVTLGAAANVPEGTAVQVRQSPVNELLLKGLPIPVGTLERMTTLAWPSAGGDDQETIAHASGRAAEALHAHDRLVDLAQQARTNTLDQIESRRVRELKAPANAANLLDLERIALDVPGTRVARAHARPGLDARFPCLSAPGSITLIVVPDMPIAQPQPTAGLLRAIARYLDRRRIVTTMLHVVGPTYVAVTVTARVRARRGAAAAELGTRIEQALNAFLDPLKGGPEGLGWPFGRPVYRSEILQLIDGVPGVDNVRDLTLTAAGGSPQCGNLALCPTSLAAAARHHPIEVE